jgi:hypothetical protein
VAFLEELKRLGCVFEGLKRKNIVKKTTLELQAGKIGLIKTFLGEVFRGNLNESWGNLQVVELNLPALFPQVGDSFSGTRPYVEHIHSRLQHKVLVSLFESLEVRLPDVIVT